MHYQNGRRTVNIIDKCRTKMTVIRSPKWQLLDETDQCHGLNRQKTEKTTDNGHFGYDFITVILVVTVNLKLNPMEF